MVGEWPVRPVPMLLMTEEGGPAVRLIAIALLPIVVPEPRFELERPCGATEFKSAASTSSATPARGQAYRAEQACRLINRRRTCNAPPMTTSGIVQYGMFRATTSGSQMSDTEPLTAP
jgi:hypothetical protein